MKINKPHLLLVLVSFSLVVSGCDNIKKMQPEIYAEKVVSEKLTEPEKSNDLDKVQTPQSEVNFPANSAAKTQWSTFNRDEQVNEIKRIIENYGGELQGLAYSDTGVIAVADVYVLNADISAARHLQLTEKLSKLIGTPVVINIQDSKLTQEMGSQSYQQLIKIRQQIFRFIMTNMLTKQRVLQKGMALNCNLLVTQAIQNLAFQSAINQTNSLYLSLKAQSQIQKS